MKEPSQDVVELLKKSQLPVYREIFKNLAPFSLFCHPRMTGKSYNLVLGLMALAIEKKLNLCFSRLWEESLKDSLWREVVDKIQLFDLEKLFKITHSHIIFKPTNVYFFFRSLANYESFKGLQGVSLLYIDEVQQISQETMQLVVPSIRGRERKIVLSGNLPASGKVHWLYQTFYINPLPSYRIYEVRQEDNTASFANSYALKVWREEQKVFFRGKEQDYKREILGIWTQNSSSRIFPLLVKKEFSSCRIDMWLYHYKQGQHFWLAVALKGKEVLLVQESTLIVPVGFRRSIPIWLSSSLSVAIKTFKSYGFKVRPQKDTSVEDLAYWFAQRKLVINSSLHLAGEDLASLSWSDDLSGEDQPTLGLVGGALSLLAGI